MTDEQERVVRNTAADISGHLVQAGTVFGGIHLGPPAPPTPRQLPAAPGGFAGRYRELTGLTAALGTMADTLPIAVISGAGGIGKTWLALHWAHRNADRFPDGQLFVDLRGFTPHDRPLAADDVVTGFLTALGVGPGRVPADPAARVGLYRSLLSGRRVLVVLDNARDSDQLTPLLPGSPSCTVLVTSRDRLAGLVHAHSAKPLTLDGLPDVEAHEVLVARVGAERVYAEPEAATDLVSFCAGYPLALGIVAGRAISSPHLPLAAWSADLGAAQTPLVALDDGDAPASLSAVLSWSYHALTTEQASVFGLLGLMPGPDISLSAAASLLDRPEADTALLLRELTGVSLLQRHVSRRYRMHDMIRLYAADQAHRGHNAHSRRMTLHRLVDYYARAADEVLGSAFSEQDSPAEQRRRDAEAWAWLDEERSCLEAAQAVAIKENLHRAVWKLARALDTYYYRRGHVDDQIAVCEAGLSAARRLRNLDSQARAHRLLGVAYTRAGCHVDAIVHLDQAMAFAEQAANQSSQANPPSARAGPREVR